MSVNRVKNFDESPETPKVHVIQTPLGVVKVVTTSDDQDGDPLGFAIQTFHVAMESEESDPLACALIKLKQLADDGTQQPLHAGLSLLQQMSGMGLLPPMSVLLEGTNVTNDDVTNAVGTLKLVAGPGVPEPSKSIFDKLDNQSLN